MTQQKAETNMPKELAQEIETMLDTGQFPQDTDWQAEYRIQEMQTPGVRNPLKPEWEYALNHPYNGLEQVLTDNAETIFDQTEHGLPVAYRFEPTCQDGEIVLMGRLHPAVRTHKDEYHTIDDETIARARIHVRMKTHRSQALVKAFMAENHPCQEATPADDASDQYSLTPEGKFSPNTQWDLEYETFIETGEEYYPDYPHPDWVEMLTDAGGRPKAMTGQQEDIFMNVLGAVHAVMLAYQVNSRGEVVISATVHPADTDCLDWQVDTGATHAAAEITIRSRNPVTAAAMRQYVQRFLE